MRRARGVAVGVVVIGIVIAASATAARGARDNGPSPGPVTVMVTGPTSATVSASLAGGRGTTRYAFSYGTTTAYGAWTPTATLHKDESRTVSATLTGLSAGAAQHVRLVAGDDKTVVNGPDASFATPASASPAPTPTPSPTATPTAGAPPTGAGTTPVDPQAALGSTVVVAPVQGAIEVRVPGSASFAPLAAGAAIPVGSAIDARHGTVALTSALNAGRQAQTGRFHGGVFAVRQAPGGGGVTDIYLRGASFAACPTQAGAALARAAGKRRPAPRRTLWGSDDHGRFRTHGRDSVATVRGTRWETIDRCDGTLTRVLAGAVAVHDRRRDRTVVVRAGHRYLARHQG